LFSIQRISTHLIPPALTFVSTNREQPPPPQKKRGKNVLSAHLHSLLALAQMSNGFKAIFQAFRGGELKFIAVTTNFRLLFQKNVTIFTGFQTLTVTCTCAWKIMHVLGGRGLFSYL